MDKPKKHKHRDRRARIAVTALIVAAVCAIYGVEVLPTVLIVLAATLVFEFVVIRGISWFNGTQN